MVTSLDPNLLLSIYSSRVVGGTASSASLFTKRTVPTAPWSRIPPPEQAAATAKANIKAVLAGRGFVNENETCNAFATSTDTGPPPNLPIAPLEEILAELDRDREDRCT